MHAVSGIEIQPSELYLPSAISDKNEMTERDKIEKCQDISACAGTENSYLAIIY